MPLKYVRAWQSRWQQRSLNIRSWDELSSSDLLQDAKIALVGNAGYLTDLVQGEQIDAHDVVIRMNNFRIAGFEKCVGRKTNVFLTNFWEDIDYSNPDAVAAELLVSSMPNNFRTHRSAGVALRHGPMITAGMRQMRRRQVYVPPLPWFHQCVAQIGRYPTTGAAGVFLSVHLLMAAAKSLFITGFSFFEGRNHYFGDRGKDTANHNVDREKQLLREALLPLVASSRVTMDATMYGSMTSPAAA